VPAGAGEPPAPAPFSDAAVFARIETLREKAARLVVDGKAGDWEGIPSFADPAGDAGGDASRDVLRVALAARAEDAVILVALAGPLPAAGHALWLDLDFTGHATRDLRLGIGGAGPPLVRIYPEDRGSFDAFGVPVEVVAGEVVEVRVPLGLVAALLGPDAGRSWTEGPRRRWVRVRTYTCAADGTTFVDHGPAVGSFRLADDWGPLDPPPPRWTRAARAVPFPLGGKWLVRQGALGLWSHRDQWAYDFGRVNDALQPSRAAGSPDNADYFAFGEPVRAPEAGTVLAAADGTPDNPALEGETQDPERRSGANFVLLGLEDGFSLSFLHLRKGSVPVRPGERLAAGALLGQVGNSGDSRAPHLHLALLGERAGKREALPLALRAVRVGLNPGREDPWARDLESWDVREGWFVESREPAGPGK